MKPSKNYLTREVLDRHIRGIIAFWKPAVDWKGGGIHYRMKDFGEGPDRRKGKCLLMHVRQLYDFSVGYEMGIPGCARIARHLYRTLDDIFLNKQEFYDSFTEPNRWFPADEISAYNQYYTVVGISRYSRALGGREAYEKAQKLFLRAKKKFTGGADFSTRGAFGLLNKKTGKLSWKSGNALLHLYEGLVNLGLAADEIYCCSEREKVLDGLKPHFDGCEKLITRKIYDKTYKVTLEDFDDDMSISREQRYGNVTNAHALEWIGFMIEAEWLTGRKIPFLRTKGRELLDLSFDRADSPLGAFKNDYFLREGRSVEWTSFWARSSRR